MVFFFSGNTFSVSRLYPKNLVNSFIDQTLDLYGTWLGHFFLFSIVFPSVRKTCEQFQ